MASKTVFLSAVSVEFREARESLARELRKAGCDVMQVMHAADFVAKMMAPKARPGAKVLNVEPIPDVDEQVRKQAQQATAQMQQSGLKMRFTAELFPARRRRSSRGRRHGNARRRRRMRW